MADEIGSNEWITKSNATLARLEVGAPEIPIALIVDVEIRSTNGNVSFSLVVDDGTARVRPNTGNKSNLTLVLDVKTANGINEGSKSVADAIADGEIKVRGDVSVLMAASETVADLAAALASILE